MSEAGSKFGALGPTVEEAQKTGFFTWFHLAETGSQAAGNGRTKVEFRPTGEKFHDLAKLVVECEDATRVIRSLELRLARTFIESRGNGPFAADITKSFLISATPEADEEAVSPVAHEITERAYSAGGVIYGPGYQRPVLPEKPRPGFLVYVGQRAEAKIALTELVVWFRNVAEEGAATFSVAITEDAGWASGGLRASRKILRKLF